MVLASLICCANASRGRGWDYSGETLPRIAVFTGYANSFPVKRGGLREHLLSWR